MISSGLVDSARASDGVVEVIGTISSKSWPCRMSKPDVDISFIWLHVIIYEPTNIPP